MVLITSPRMIRKPATNFGAAGDLHVGRYNPTLRFVASRQTAPGLIVVPTAKNGMVLAIDPTVAKGDFTKEKVGEGKPVRWVMMNNTPDVPSPLISDGIVYLCRKMAR